MPFREEVPQKLLRILLVKILKKSDKKINLELQLHNIR